MPGSAPDDVVHGEQQRVVVGCDLDQHHAQRHLLHQPEGPVGLAVDQCARCALSALSAHAVPLQHGQRARVLSRQHRLQQAPVALQQPCAQDLVPGRQGTQRGLQRARIQRPAQAQRLRHVVGGAVGVHVVQRNHLRLVGRAGHACPPLLWTVGRRWNGCQDIVARRCAAQKRGQASDGRGLEQLRRGDVGARRLAHLRHDHAHLWKPSQQIHMLLRAQLRLMLQELYHQTASDAGAPAASCLPLQRSPPAC